MSRITYRELVHDIYVHEHPDALGPIYSIDPPFKSRTDSGRDLALGKIVDLWPEYLARFPQTNRLQILYGRYGVNDVRLMTTEMVQDYLSYLETVLLPEEVK